MRDKKVYIGLIVIFIIFFIVMFLCFGVENINQEKYASTIIVGDSTAWRYEKKRWLNYRNKSSLQQLSWKQYSVYDNNEAIGNYSLWYDDKWYVFDDDKNAVQVDGNLLAVSSNFDMKITGFKEEEVDDYSYIQHVLNENNLSTSSKFTSISKVLFDLDGDSVEEEFYLISNAFPIDFNPDYIFSIVFMVKNNIVYYIYNDISENRSFNGCKPYFNSFLDTNNDGIYEFILSCGRYSNQETVNMLYEFKEDDFKILISNQ